MKPIKVMWTTDNKKFAYIDGKPYTALEVEVFKDDHPMYEYEEIVMTEKENKEMLKKSNWFSVLKGNDFNTLIKNIYDRAGEMLSDNFEERTKAYKSLNESLDELDRLYERGEL